MKKEEYNKLVKEYKVMGYVEIGDINKPYFFPKLSEEEKKVYSKQFEFLWGDKYLKKE